MASSPVPGHPHQPLAFQRHRLLPAHTIPPSPTLKGSSQSWKEVLKASTTPSLLEGACALRDSGLKRKRFRAPSSYTCTHTPGILPSCLSLLSELLLLWNSQFSCSMNPHDFSFPRLLSFVWQLEFTIYFFSFLAMLHGMWDLSSLTKDQTHASCSPSMEV